MSNIDHEMFSLYRNSGGELFSDASREHGVADATRLLSGWGLKFFDIDNDGRVDLLLANGHPDDMIALRAPDVKYKEPLLLFRHDGQRLRNVSAQAGPVFSKPLAARGLAVGDYNNDGRVDALIACNGEAPLLLRNQASPDNHWVGVKLQGVNCNRDAVGARITWSAAGVTKSRLKTGGGSYLSSHDPREVLGLGRSTTLDWLEITWPRPSRRIERFSNVPIDRYVTIVEGAGGAGGAGGQERQERQESNPPAIQPFLPIPPYPAHLAFHAISSHPPIGPPSVRASYSSPQTRESRGTGSFLRR